MWLRNIFFVNKQSVWHHISDTGSLALRIHTQCSPLLAGHSKWANIRHIKALKDGQKSAIFAKIARQIRLAVQDGGSADPELNTSLRSAIDDALRKNMPMSTIQNNIKKSQQNKNTLKKHQIQIRFKQKVFAVCILYTENFSGLKMDMAPILRKSGSSFVDAAHLFEDFGLIEASVDMKKKTQDVVTEDAIECGAEDIEFVCPTTGIVHFICNAIEMAAVRNSLERRGYEIKNVEHVFKPKTTVQLSAEEMKTYSDFLNKLCALPGIEDIYDNVASTEC